MSDVPGPSHDSGKHEKIRKGFSSAMHVTYFYGKMQHGALSDMSYSDGDSDGDTEIPIIDIGDSCIIEQVANEERSTSVGLDLNWKVSRPRPKSHYYCLL